MNPTDESPLVQRSHAQIITFIEYRALSGVFRTIDPPPPPTSPHRECVPLLHQMRGAMGGWGVNISEDARHWIGLLQYNPSTIQCI